MSSFELFAPHLQLSHIQGRMQMWTGAALRPRVSECEVSVFVAQQLQSIIVEAEQYCITSPTSRASRQQTEVQDTQLFAT
mmetsp:Transcript_7578/g.14041  ORF Transcript_7578/g.14041 Transcript_7578/m.14041 type:complete len:80 (+) Transcript_7578:2673-2912(+)